MQVEGYISSTSEDIAPEGGIMFYIYLFFTFILDSKHTLFAMTGVVYHRMLITIILMIILTLW